MANRASRAAQETFLVEHYRPGATVAELSEWAIRVRDVAAEMARDGRSVRYVRSTIVPGDESMLCLLEAADEALVRETYARAGIPCERISVAIPEGDRA